MTSPDPQVQLTTAGPRRGHCPEGHPALVFNMHVLSDTGVSEAPLGSAVFCATCFDVEKGYR